MHELLALAIQRRLTKLAQDWSPAQTSAFQEGANAGWNTQYTARNILRDMNGPSPEDAARAATQSAQSAAQRVAGGLRNQAFNVANDVPLSDPPPPERGTAWVRPGVYSNPTTVEEHASNTSRGLGDYQAAQTGNRAHDLAVRMSRQPTPIATPARKPQALATRKKIASQLLEKIAFLEPSAQDYYMSMLGPLGAAKAPPGQRASAAIGSGAGMLGGYAGGKALEKMMLERMSGRGGRAGKALSLLAKFPIFLGTGIGSVMGARAAQSM